MTFEEMKPMFAQMDPIELREAADYLTTRYASYGAVWVRKNELETMEHMRASGYPDEPYR